MRARGAHLQQLLLGLALLAALAWNLAHGAEILAVQLGSGPTGTRAEVQVDGEAEYRLIHLQDPARLVVDLPGSRTAAAHARPSAVGVEKGGRPVQRRAGTTRLVFVRAAPARAHNPRYESGPGGLHLVIEWPGDGHPDLTAHLAASSSPSPVTAGAGAQSAT